MQTIGRFLGLMIACAVALAVVSVVLSAPACMAQLHPLDASRSARATADSLSIDATATAVMVQATATAVQRQTESEARSAVMRAEVLEPVMAYGAPLLLVVVIIAVGAGLGVGGFFLVRAIRDALALRSGWRVVRGQDGFPMLVSKPDAEGRVQLMQPHLAPGPLVQIAPPGVEANGVTVGGGDADVTRQAQYVQAIALATRPATRPGVDAGKAGTGKGLVQQAMDTLASGPGVRVIGAPPPHLMDDTAVGAIDADWRVLPTALPTTLPTPPQTALPPAPAEGGER